MMANAKLQKQALLPPRSPFPTAAAAPSPYADHGLIARPQSASHHRHAPGHGHHQRTSSESFIEEQPSWLDDLLDEPETPVRQHGRAGHRRSSSDSFALFDGGAAGAGAYANGFEGIRGGGQAASWGGVPEYYAKPGSFGRPQGRPWEQGMPNLVGHRHVRSPPVPAKEKVGGHHGPPNALRDCDHGMDKRAPYEAGHDQKEVGMKEGVLPKHGQSEADTKRAKQQYAQRSRVRKLQYIAELERKVQALQSEGIEVSAEMEFLTQQNIMLDLENKALKQRLESLAQEQLIKRFQQEVFEREIGRLRSLYQQQQQQQQAPARGRTNSRDLDSQFANLSLKHKDPNSGRDALSGPLRT
uniref:BZIP domain-containing protein n=1 Tax=Arundo donax TaxID=35708 RepID=A0A0A9E2N8_ARUDO